MEVLTTETLGITFKLGIPTKYLALAELAPYMQQQQTDAGDVSLTGAFTTTPDALLHPLYPVFDPFVGVASQWIE